jgi:hypothetical protein
MQKLITSTFIVLLLSFTALAQQSTAEDSTKAVAINSARQWLALVDSANYAASWDSAASFFQLSINKENWVNTLQGLRPPFGAVLQREVQSAVYYKALPNAPAGEYVVIQFKTKFAQKADAIETVTPMKKPGAQDWRVSGYYLK